MKKDEFLKQIKSPHWQKKRLEIMERDNFTCQYCLDTENTLTVHHKSYKEGVNYWDYADSELITLCEYCHEQEHLNKDELYFKFLEIKKYYETLGFSYTFLVSIFRQLRAFPKFQKLLKEAYLNNRCNSDLKLLKCHGVDINKDELDINLSEYMEIKDELYELQKKYLILLNKDK